MVAHGRKNESQEAPAGFIFHGSVQQDPAHSDIHHVTSELPLYFYSTLMRTILFTIVLSLYGFSALEMHEWVRVPQAVAHLLEHHSSWGHHDKQVNGHDEHEGDHNPFDDGCDELLCACATPAFFPEHAGMSVLLSTSISTMSGPEQLAKLATYSGNVWNPPKRV